MTAAVEKLIRIKKENDSIIGVATIANFASPICRGRMAKLGMDEFDKVWEEATKDIEKALSGDFSGLSEKELDVFGDLASFYYDGLFMGHIYAKELDKYWA